MRGWLHRKCETMTEHNEKHDAYFCRACDEWLEESCGGNICDYCRDRPEKPSEAKP